MFGNTTCVKNYYWKEIIKDKIIWVNAKIMPDVTIKNIISYAQGSIVFYYNSIQFVCLYFYYFTLRYKYMDP
jgi:hypothetical protein